MTIKIERFERLRDRKINEFSGRFMSNAKWLKLFRSLSLIYPETRKCFIIDVYDDRAREITIPPIHEFDLLFSGEGIKDGVHGPMLFKEIKYMEFPQNWPIKRTMRTEMLQPMVYEQDLEKITQAINQIGELMIESDINSLRIYGYK